jgi:hypothetical protein
VLSRIPVMPPCLACSAPQPRRATPKRSAAGEGAAGERGVRGGHAYQHGHRREPYAPAHPCHFRTAWTVQPHRRTLCSAVLPLARVQEDSPMPETSWLAACKDKAAEFVNATPEARWVLEPLPWVGSA